MILHNRYYGHQSILCNFVGLRSERPIFGSVVHGWAPYVSAKRAAEMRWNSCVPLFVWNRRHLEQLQHQRVRNVHLIGSPFAYLTNMVRPSGESVPREGTIVLPSHSSDAHRSDLQLDSLMHESESRCPPPYTLVLFYQDWDSRIVERIRDRNQWEIASFGRRFDSSFLYRLIRQFRARSHLLSTQIGSGLLYGGSLGLNVYLTSDFDVEEMRYRGLSHPMREVARRLAFAKDHSEEFSRLAESELGFGHLREEPELLDLLGLRGAKRWAANILGNLAYAYSGHKAKRIDDSYAYPGPNDAMEAGKAP